VDGWYALQVLTGKEADISAMLRRSGVRAIAPSVYRMERRGGEWETVLRRAIPGYVFVKCTMTAPLFYHLTAKPGVLRLLGRYGEQFEAIPPEQVTWIEVLHTATDGKNELVSHVRKDETGTYIMDGPLWALSDKVVNIDIRRRRATVAISIYENTYAVDMAIEPADEATDKHPESAEG